MWWTTTGARSTNVPVEIQHANGKSTVYVNQQQNGGKWNDIGEYTMIGGTACNVKITAPGTAIPPSTCADAVKFTNLHKAAAIIESITPNPADYEEEIYFSGYGVYDGTITGYKWNSSIDDDISSAASFSASTLSPGNHRITFTVKDNANPANWSAPTMIYLTVGQPTFDGTIDNDDSRTTSAGTWGTSTTSGCYGSNYRYGCSTQYNTATYNWKFTPNKTGTYRVEMWWKSSEENRSNQIPVTIQHAGGPVIIDINQIQDGGQWNSLGEYLINAGTLYDVKITASRADPITYLPSTCADAVQLTFLGSLNVPPTASINSITPNPANEGQQVSFSGSGSDSDGTVAAYKWESDIDGVISNQASFNKSDLSVGHHLITFTTQDNDDDWSIPMVRNLTVGQPTSDIIIDNGDTGTFADPSNRWTVSGTSNYYGLNSLTGYSTSSPSVIAKYTWSFTPQITGIYQILMWWTTTENRGTSIPVTIYYDAEDPETVNINQWRGEKQWNYIGEYPMNAGTAYNVIITAPYANPTSHLPSTSSDAVRFKLVD